ncbi:uncharacterized protein SAPINGB_P001373 [Magnusiomyces paraingens]|uniref:Lactoylglutathione lyase n=1 Tax=Magnusiomyces paraingens TaxID=2606893 RepID=A0A5E8B7J0_9ASCO|nr:uncharacterized protein SAPINGB_P001373 [Saprochaete ingens]VVT46760.1 unnamed protein product [Saprochaete ingens]
MLRLKAISRQFILTNFTSSTSTKQTFVKAANMSTSAVDTTGFKYNHTMIRIKDPKISVPFYEKNFGMKLYGKYSFKGFGFDIYYLGIESAVPAGTPWYKREGLLELTHNYGTENDESYTLNNGNKEPHRGFGHICFSVDNITVACTRLEDNGVKFQKKLTDGRQKDIAFALDPDGYWIELISNKSIEPKAETTDITKYKYNHSMIRVKDIKASLKFYQEVLGMKLIRTLEFPEAKFSLYFLGYSDTPNEEDHSNREALLELTHNWGTENDPDFKYHNGNDAPQGYGHIGLTVPDVPKAMAEFEAAGVSIKKRVTDGKMNFIGFILDPDNYWIEILPDQDLPEIKWD